MTGIITPSQNIIFMKVGVHAQESLESIIARKTMEIERAGYALWGYGGSTCNPGTMVQPFAKACAREGNKVYLCMQEMKSKHAAEPLAAKQYSTDNITWHDIPPEINVLGSRYALAIKGLHKTDEPVRLSLNRTTIAVGPSVGALGNRYIRGQADKACLVVGHNADLPEPDDTVVEIGLIAELCDPYAVYLKGTR